MMQHQVSDGWNCVVLHGNPDSDVSDVLFQLVILVPKAYGGQVFLVPTLYT